MCYYDDEFDKIILQHIPEHLVKSDKITNKFIKFYKNASNNSDNFYKYRYCVSYSLEKFGMILMNKANKILFNIIMHSKKMSFSNLPYDILKLIYSFGCIDKTEICASENNKIRIYNGPIVHRVTFITLKICDKEYYIDHDDSIKNLLY